MKKLRFTIEVQDEIIEDPYQFSQGKDDLKRKVFLCKAPDGIGTSLVGFGEPYKNSYDEITGWSFWYFPLPLNTIYGEDEDKLHDALEDIFKQLAGISHQTLGLANDIKEIKDKASHPVSGISEDTLIRALNIVVKN